MQQLPIANVFDKGATLYMRTIGTGVIALRHGPCGLLVLMLLLYATVAFSRDGQRSANVTSLVAAEREFARASVAFGIRRSFLQYFADDAIVFQPQPVKYKEAVGDLPPPADPLAYTLDWQPLYSDVSAAGDLGYNTGPYILTDNSPARRPPQYGFFFSVWKRQADGLWKVVLDAGIETNEAYTGPHELSTGRVSREASAASRSGEARLFELELALQEAVRTRGLAGAYSQYLNNDSRLHRNGMQPLQGQKAIVRYLSQYNDYPAWKPLFADIARSGDLGYVYGSYRLTGNTDQKTGYYARVWKLGVNNRWLVVLDTTSPNPSEK